MSDEVFSLVVTLGILALLFLWVPALEAVARQILHARQRRAARAVASAVQSAAIDTRSSELVSSSEGVLQG